MFALRTLVAVWAVLLVARAQKLTTVSYESDHSELKVILPKSLKLFAGPNGLRHSQALFGTPSFGGDKLIAGELFYVTEGDQKNGCEDLQVPNDVPKGTQMIFLVDRGSCDFVQKMRVAQKAGAVAVIIADNVCQCSDTMNNAIWSENSENGRTPKQKDECMRLGRIAAEEGRVRPGDFCENGLPYMADDGTGQDVTIPSFLIDYLDAQPLKDCMKSASATDGSTTILPTGSAFRCLKGTKVVVSLGWDIPRKDNTVDWQLWSSSNSEAVFKKSFATSAKKLQERINFTPRYFIWDGEQWGCTVADMCSTQCTRGGYYCNPDPDNDLNEGVSGRDVIEENLREICIWEYAESQKNPGIWWDYVKTFSERCHPEKIPTADKFNEACSIAVQQSVTGLDAKKVADCVKTSWKDKRNAKLDKELAERADLKILQLPTAIVNGVILRGGVTPYVILSSICNGFAAGQAPKLCSCVDRSNGDNVLDCIDSDCAPDQKLCAKDKKCYHVDEYNMKCSDICPKDTDVFCPSMSQCLPKGQNCPVCSDNTPAYCPLLGKCVDSFLSCMPGPTGGVSAFNVFVITILVVSMAGCGAYAFWKRQKARLHDDVRAILSSYMELEENDDERVSRPSRNPRVEHYTDAPTSSSTGGGQDAVAFI